MKRAAGSAMPVDLASAKYGVGRATETENYGAALKRGRPFSRLSVDSVTRFCAAAFVCTHNDVGWLRYGLVKQNGIVTQVLRRLFEKCGSEMDLHDDFY